MPGTPYETAFPVFYKFINTPRSPRYNRQSSIYNKNVRLYILLVNVSDSILTPERESLCLWAYLGFACLIYFRWAFVVIDRICTFLGINCLTIKNTESRIKD
jgi:hypothetical protein